MKLFVSVCHDRHVDNDIKVWKDSLKAISYAKAFMLDYLPRNIEEYDIIGWLYNATCESSESSAYVFETELKS